MLEVRLFGSGQAWYCGRPLPGFPGQQPYLLFCYLLLNRRRPHPREQLAAVFWGESTTLSARKHLRNAIWRLRRALADAGAPADEYLVIDDGSVNFPGAGAYRLDVEELEIAVSRHSDRTAHDLEPAQVQELAAAADLYAGDLLQGIYDDWCLYDRERLRLLYLGALGKLMAYHSQRGDYEQALGYGQRILACDNTRERVHRRMMQLYWLSGQRDRALAQYKRCAQILRETLGIAPLAETRRLHQQMLRGECEAWNWWLFQPPPPNPDPSHVAMRTIAEDTLTRLRRLQATLDQTRAELQSIERLISSALEGAVHADSADSQE
jgi:DNA-binding SARP family transcriptional activator